MDSSKKMVVTARDSSKKMVAIAGGAEKTKYLKSVKSNT